ncbi:MAG: AMP-binding protein, partial [Rhodoferax sp.]
MPAQITVSPTDHPLQGFYRWERERANQVFLTQPVGKGLVHDITWGEAGHQVRHMAAWLQSQGWPAGSRVAILGKNSAHWILADLAIQMAGHVSIPIYPTFNAETLCYILQHSEARACFVGKMDDTLSLQSGVPEGVQLLTLPLAPTGLAGGLRWDDLVAQASALAGEPAPDFDAICTIIYTS